QNWISRSASVDLPWSICATIEKLRIWVSSVIGLRDSGAALRGPGSAGRRGAAGGELEAACGFHPPEPDGRDDCAHQPDIPARPNAGAEGKIHAKHAQEGRLERDPEADRLEEKRQSSDTEPGGSDNPKRELAGGAESPMQHPVEHQPDEDAADHGGLEHF